jgi:hypothetical protein
VRSRARRFKLDDVYRPLRRADCGEIARHYNRNLAELEPVWCAGGSEWDGNRVWLHRLVLMARGRGRLVDQVHERRGRVISYFAGYTRGDQATFSIGVVDLDLPDPLETWRSDVVHLFAATLRTGVRDFRIQASSDRAWFVEWMEQEVGMARLADRNVWVAGRAVIASHVDAPAKAASAHGHPAPEQGRSADRLRVPDGRSRQDRGLPLTASQGRSRPQGPAAAPTGSTVSPATGGG